MYNKIVVHKLVYFVCFVYLCTKIEPMSKKKRKRIVIVGCIVAALVVAGWWMMKPRDGEPTVATGHLERYTDFQSRIVVTNKNT